MGNSDTTGGRATRRVHWNMPGAEADLLSRYATAHGIGSETETLVEMVKVGIIITRLLAEGGRVVDRDGRTVSLLDHPPAQEGSRRKNFNFPMRAYKAVESYQRDAGLKHLTDALGALVRITARCDEVVAQGGRILRHEGQEVLIIPMISPRLPQPA